MSKEIEGLQKALKKFASDREWEQFHSPKNLSMALSVEASELVENFQWLTEKQSYLTNDLNTLSSVKEEIADVFLYLIRLCDQLDVDVLEVARAKIKSNDRKYPIELCKGSSKKYNQL